MGSLTLSNNLLAKPSYMLGNGGELSSIYLKAECHRLYEGEGNANKTIPAKTLLLCSIPVGGLHRIRALSSAIIELTAPCPPPDVGRNGDYNMEGRARVGYS